MSAEVQLADYTVSLTGAYAATSPRSAGLQFRASFDAIRGSLTILTPDASRCFLDEDGHLFPANSAQRGDYQVSLVGDYEAESPADAALQFRESYGPLRGSLEVQNDTSGQRYSVEESGEVIPFAKVPSGATL